MPLTEEQKAEYKIKGEEFNQSRLKLRTQISELEKQIKKAVPKTPNGIFFCSSCNVMSMAYTKIEHRSLGVWDIYNCEICGKEYRDNLLNHPGP